LRLLREAEARLRKVRLFVAVLLPDYVIQELLPICEQLKKQLLFVGHCTRPQNLHITLKFLGFVDKALIPKIDERLKAVHAPLCKATIGKLGVLPHPKMVRILFADIHSPELSTLVKQVEVALADMFASEDRAFKAHMTIGRIKKVRDKAAFLAQIDKVELLPLEFEIHSFFLIQSELTPNGPIYKAIASYTLSET